MEQRKIVIGLTGYKNSGKNTAAIYLLELLRKENTRVASFMVAGAIRREAALRYPVAADVLYDDSVKDVPSDLLSGNTPRAVLRAIGAEYRKENENVWIEKLLARIRAFFYRTEIAGREVVLPPDEHGLLQTSVDYTLPTTVDTVYALITDMRMPAEAKAFRQLELNNEIDRFILLELDRGSESDGDATENINSLSPWISRTIENKGSLTELKQVLESFVFKGL